MGHRVMSYSFPSSIYYSFNIAQTLFLYFTVICDQNDKCNVRHNINGSTYMAKNSYLYVS